MGPGPRLMLLPAVLVAAVIFTISAQAGMRAAGDVHLDAAAAAASAAPDRRAEGETAPKEKQTPPPAPNGCPFRNGKLELIT